MFYNYKHYLKERTQE